jgi:replicative DNA helicase
MDGEGTALDLDAERAVLGAMLLSKDSISDVVALLNESDFYEPKHRLMYGVIVDLFAAREPADTFTVEAELAKRGQLSTVGQGFVSGLVEPRGARKDPAVAAQRVRGAAVLRAVIEVARKIERLAATSRVEDVDETGERSAGRVLQGHGQCAHR